MRTFRTSYNFTAILSLFPTENGGRKKPVYDSFRPSFSFNSVNHVSGEISFPEQDELRPGATATAIVKILPSKHIRQHLKSGDSFTILEGAKIIGSGVIQQINQETKIPAIQ
jgi:translation elongation factor EF-Tu-like GTPase